MEFRQFTRDKIAELLKTYPDLYIRAQAAYYRRNIFKGVRLLCYAKGKCTWENFSDIGPGENQIQVKTLFTSLNTGTELAYFQRLPNTSAEFPYTPIGSGVGEVIRLGRRVSGFSVGDVVVGAFQHSTKQVLTVDKVAKVLRGVTLKDASLLQLCIIAMQGIRMGLIKNGENFKIVVMGQGIIGRLATVIARGLGANVTCVTQTAEKLRRLGEQQGIALADTGGIDRLKSLNADVVIDSTGDPEAIHLAINASRKGGRVVLLGSNRGKTASFDFNGAAMKKSLTIVGAHIKNQPSMPAHIGMNYQGEARFIQELVLAGKLPLSEVVTHHITCLELAEFYQKEFPKIRDGCGIVVDWTNGKIPKEDFSQLLKIGYRSPRNADKPLQMALVGCGSIGDVNAKAITQSSSFKLALVMDSDVDRARVVGEKYSVPFTDSFEDVTKGSSIDAVLIAVPHFLHQPLAQQAALAKKHILVEKPIATSVEEAYEMIGIAQANQVVLRTFLSFVFEAPKQLARALIEHDAVGEIFGVSMEFYQYRKLKYWYAGAGGRFKINWRGKKQFSGGGVLIMNIVHAIDYLHYITGIDIKSVFAYCDTLWHPVEVEDTVGLVFRGAKEEIGTISAGNNVRGSEGDYRSIRDDVLRVWGANGQIVLHGDILRFYSLRPIGRYRALQWHTIRSRVKRDFRATYLDYFGQQIREKRQADFRESGYLSLAVVMSAYKSVELGRPVDVNEFLLEINDNSCENA